MRAPSSAASPSSTTTVVCGWKETLFTNPFSCSNSEPGAIEPSSNHHGPLMTSQALDLPMARLAMVLNRIFKTCLSAVFPLVLHSWSVD